MHNGVFICIYSYTPIEWRHHRKVCAKFGVRRYKIAAAIV